MHRTVLPQTKSLRKGALKGKVGIVQIEWLAFSSTALFDVKIKKGIMF